MFEEKPTGTGFEAAVGGVVVVEGREYQHLHQLVWVFAGLGEQAGSGDAKVAALDVASQSHNQGRRTLRYTAKGNAQRERCVDAYVCDAIDEYLAARRPRPGGRWASRIAHWQQESM
jgi:hypothetical protein